MSHPVRRLSPPPDIALERISQTTIGLPASRSVESPGCNQHRSVPLMPRRSCKKPKNSYDNNINVCQLYTCRTVCIMSVQCLHKSAKSVVYKVCSIQLVHTWHMTHKSALDADFYACLHHFCTKSAHFCIKSALSLQKYQP